MLQILGDVCSNATPNRRLALVCKFWRSLLLGCSAFWGRIYVRAMRSREVAYATDRFRRRLELSKQTLLDVTIYLDSSVDEDAEEEVDEEEEGDVHALFVILCKIDVSRWHTLKLSSNHDTVRSNSGPWKHLKNLKGKLSSLKVLDIEDHRDFPSQGWLYTLLMESSGTITTLRTTHGIPDCLKNHAFLKNVRTLVQKTAVVYYGSKAYVQHWLGSWAPQAQLQLPLPPHLVLRCVAKAALQRLDLSAVRFLEITGRYGCRMDLLKDAVHLPSLTSLTLENSLSDIRLLKAPHLQELKVVESAANPWLPTIKRNGEENRVLHLFDKDAHEIVVDLRSLTIDVSLTYRPLNSVVRHWSKLRYLVVNLSYNALLSPNSTFPKAFIKPEQPICPGLEVLGLKTVWSTEESNAWRNTVQTMFQQRATLRKVSWTHGPAGGYTSVHFRNESFTPRIPPVP